MFSLSLATLGLTSCAQPDAEMSCSLEYTYLGVSVPFCIHAQCTGENCLLTQPTCEGFTASLNAAIQDGSFTVETTSSCDGDLTGSTLETGDGTSTTIDCYSIDEGGKAVCEGFE